MIITTKQETLSRRITMKNQTTKYLVIIKNWKTGQIMQTFEGVTAEDLEKIEIRHHKQGNPDCDVEATEIKA